MMNTLSSTACRRLELQGYVGLPASALAPIDRWLRLAPALCIPWVAAGMLMQSALVVAALALLSAVGAVTRSHPFDILYNRWLRRIFDTPSLPPYPAPRRFACVVAAVWLCAMAAAFISDEHLMADLLGLSLILVAGINVISGFCVPAWIYARFFGYPKPYRV